MTIVSKKHLEDKIYGLNAFILNMDYYTFEKSYFNNFVFRNLVDGIMSLPESFKEIDDIIENDKIESIKRYILYLNEELIKEE